MKQDIANKLGIHLPSPEQRLTLHALQSQSVVVKRDDLLHPVISGNKWRKLAPQLAQILAHGTLGILSFGGGHSNHLHALAYCCHKLGLPFTAFVRGDYRANPTPTLFDLAQWQADIRYVTKVEYRQRENANYLDEIQRAYPGYQIIPEGGSTEMALSGVAQIKCELPQEYDVVMAPVASGATLAGLIQAFADTPTRVLGVAVLKGEAYLTEQVSRFLPATARTAEWSINHDYHFGGYAKSPADLQKFCHAWTEAHRVPVEPVYSGKLFYALNDLLAQGYFAADSRILVLHTGGLQGARSI